MNRKKIWNNSDSSHGGNSSHGMQKGSGMSKYGIIIIGLLCFCMITFTGCRLKKEKEPLQTTGFAFNTTYTITFYEGGSKKLLNECTAFCTKYEDILSCNSSSGELYQLNEISKLCKESLNKLEKSGKFSGSKSEIDNIRQEIDQNKEKENKISYQIGKNGEITATLSKKLSAVIAQGLSYSEKSEGRFDITIAPVSTLWDFTADKPTVPDSTWIKQALPFVNYKMVQVNGQRVTLKKPGMEIDLGGIAKGYIADEMKTFLMKRGVKRGIINLGGNILCIGKKSEEEDFHIGIQQPFADRNETIAAVNANDSSIVSSGVYERYFKTKDGKMYHHILNPKTGYSYQNDLVGVTILSKKSIEGDALSTTCFALGLKQGMEYIDSVNDACAVFITKDEKLHYSKGFQKFLIPNS